MERSINPQLFNWSVSNQVDFLIPTCEPWRLNVTRTPTPDFLPPYLLTIFPIENAKEPRSIRLKYGSEGSVSDWVVDEPIGSRLLLSLKDTNGAEGGILPHVFEVVAGRTTDCIRFATPSVHSNFIFRPDISEQSGNSESLHVDVHGGDPPYETTLISLKVSGPHSIASIPFYQSPLIHSIKSIIKNDSLFIAVSDSKGKWAQGASILHFESHTTSGSQIVQELSPSSSLTSSHHDARVDSTSTSQRILGRRSSDDGTAIIVVDVIALVMLIIVTVAIVLCDVVRRRRRRQLDQLKNAVRLQNVGPSDPDLEVARVANEDEGSNEVESSKRGLDSASGSVMKSLPAPPPPTPATISPSARQSRMSSLQPRMISERLTTYSPPTSFGDPPPLQPSGDTYVSDVLSTLSHQTSSSSNQTAKIIAKAHAPFFGFSEGSSFDIRSGTLSRNQSKSSAFTMRTDQQTPIPPSAGSNRPSWYQLSADAPDVPPLAGKDQDDQP